MNELEAAQSKDKVIENKSKRGRIFFKFFILKQEGLKETLLLMVCLNSIFFYWKSKQPILYDHFCWEVLDIP